MKKSGAVLMIVCALIVGAIAGIIIDRSQLVRLSADSSAQQGDKLNWTLSVLENKYVDSLSRDSINQIIIPLLLSSLDPHSEYIAAEQFKAMNEPLTGKFDGIGVVFNMSTDTAQILNVIAGGPSSSVGLVAGDRIITIDGTQVAGKKIDQLKVVGMLRGQKGTTVTLGVQRGEKKSMFPVTITRGEIPINSLEASFLTKNKSAYIRLSRFAASTHREVIRAIDRLVAAGAQSVTIDLRSNGGGYLDQAIYLANEFLPRQALIVYVDGAHKERVEERADGSGRYLKMPLTILVDETSASSSEIFAAAMQDNDRAQIIGRRTFGKGLIQEQIDYADGSAARITIARYYTPLGRPLQKPYTVGQKTAYDQELLERYTHGEFTSQDSVRNDSMQVFRTAKGKILYGGGGVTPDVFIPMDNLTTSAYFVKLYQDNMIFKYAQIYADKYRQQINSIKEFKALDEFFADRENLYMGFVAWASKLGVHPTDNELSEDRKLITAQLKAYIGRNTELQESAFYYYIWPFDPSLVKSISQ